MVEVLPDERRTSTHAFLIRALRWFKERGNRSNASRPTMSPAASPGSSARFCASSPSERPEIAGYEGATPGELIRIDAKKLGRIDGISHRIAGDRTSRKRGLGWGHLNVAIDDGSRLAYTELLPAETGEACAGFLAHATAWFAANGIAVRRVMTDNAIAYTNSRLFKRRWPASAPCSPDGDRC